MLILVSFPKPRAVLAVFLVPLPMHLSRMGRPPTIRAFELHRIALTMFLETDRTRSHGLHSLSARDESRKWRTRQRVEQIVLLQGYFFGLRVERPCGIRRLLLARKPKESPALRRSMRLPRHKPCWLQNAAHVGFESDCVTGSAVRV